MLRMPWQQTFLLLDTQISKFNSPLLAAQPYLYSTMRLLLISPQTYNYHKVLQSACRANDIDFSWLDERPFANPFFKFFSRKFNRLARYLSRKYYFRKISALRDSGFSPSHVLIIKGEAIHQSVISYMRELFPNARFILYFWDSITNLPGAAAISHLFDVTITFDYKDSVEQGWKFFPLFAGNYTLYSRGCLDSPETPTPSYDWSFVGAIHSDRILVIDKLCRSSSSHRNYYIFLYAQTFFHLILHSIRHPFAFLRLKKYIHMNTLDPGLLSDIYSESRCVLDIHHPCQTGVTMRTVEALLSGKKVATTNVNALNLSISDSSRISVIDRARPTVSSEFIFSPVVPISHFLSNQYYPDNWLLRLLAH